MVIPYGDRSNVVIEPMLTDQWFVDAPKLAVKAIEAVENGDMEFVPKSYEKTYFEWMRNIQPWCISRQLWWGHQMPIWYGPDGEIFCEENVEEAQAAADRHYGRHVELTRETDVLDTWFSSGLWAFSTLGWPDKTEYLDTFYPTSVLVTGFDIIFFWVARMMMMSMYMMKKFRSANAISTVWCATSRAGRCPNPRETPSIRWKPSKNTELTRCASLWRRWKRRGAILT